MGVITYTNRLQDQEFTQLKRNEDIDNENGKNEDNHQNAHQKGLGTQDAYLLNAEHVQQAPMSSTFESKYNGKTEFYILFFCYYMESSLVLICRRSIMISFLHLHPNSCLSKMPLK